jgi:hypothetical protein
MGMRGAAAFLLVTLLGTPIASVLCDLTCAQHAHHSAHAPSAQSCHEHGSSTDGPAVTGGAGTLCHNPAGTLAATAADARPLKVTPAVVTVPSALAAYHPQRPVVARSASVGPPGIVPLTTPLRI